ncbi:hypothetical protein NON20_24900 (plasmid) [Synechocystis sp. B12]|nr:hypothetical protein NON20_24900 [Synechocystis sp. B12]
METGHSFALIATKMPKTKKTPQALDGGGVSKVFKGTDQAISAYLKKHYRISPSTDSSPKRKGVPRDYPHHINFHDIFKSWGDRCKGIKCLERPRCKS